MDVCFCPLQIYLTRGVFILSNSRVNFEISEDEDVLYRIASYYDDFEIALKPLANICKYTFKYDLQVYCIMHKKCYEKRKKFNVAHNVELLDHDIKVHSKICLYSEDETIYWFKLSGCYWVSEQPEYLGDNDPYGSDSEWHQVLKGYAKFMLENEIDRCKGCED